MLKFILEFFAATGIVINTITGAIIWCAISLVIIGFTVHKIRGSG